MCSIGALVNGAGSQPVWLEGLACNCYECSGVQSWPHVHLAVRSDCDSCVGGCALEQGPLVRAPVPGRLPLVVVEQRAIWDGLWRRLRQPAGCEGNICIQIMPLYYFMKVRRPEHIYRLVEETNREWLKIQRNDNNQWKETLGKVDVS